MNSTRASLTVLSDMSRVQMVSPVPKESSVSPDRKERLVLLDLRDLPELLDLWWVFNLVTDSSMYPTIKSVLKSLTADWSFFF